MERVRYLFNLLIAAILLITVAVNRDSKILGEPIDELFGSHSESELPPLRTTDSQGDIVINSAALEENIFGYGGKTPLLIHLTDNKISSIELGKNSETPDFLDSVIESGLLNSWSGLTLEEATTQSVDIVSGATMTSEAIIKNVRLASAHAADLSGSIGGGFSLSLKSIIALLVIAFGVVISVLKIHKKWVKTLLFALNVLVLGFWCGSFLSLSLFTSWAANGLNFSTYLIPATLLIVAVAMPLFGRKGNYCAYHCPMGAAQELISLSRKKKIRIDPKIMNILNKVRNTILALMLLLMWIGVGFSLMDYEIFSAFLFESASTAVIVTAIIFMALSIFIHRPYCRFVCPTGAILTLTQRTKE